MDEWARRAGQGALLDWIAANALFGYPYEEDIGAGGTYIDGYAGPDLYHFLLCAQMTVGIQKLFDFYMNNIIFITKCEVYTPLKLAKNFSSDRISLKIKTYFSFCLA